MIQLLGIRTFTKDGETVTTDCFHKKGWRAPSIPELFREPEKYLAQVPEKERYNLFYTIANCTDKKREFARLEVIAFDIDGVPHDKRELAALAACGALRVDPAKTALISSGGGVHVIIQMQTAVTERNWYKENKRAYGFACAAVNQALTNAGITCKTVDTTIFEPRRILRMPGTENRKPGRDPAQCVFIRPPALAPQFFDLPSFSPIGELKPGDAIPSQSLARYGQTDTDAVMGGCDFLKWAKREPHRVNEPQWYAALSIVARLTPAADSDMATACHDFSKGHPGYDPEVTDRKIAQALEASGPRTCHNINALWGRCVECPNFEKVISPITLVSPGRIPTEFTGFHTINAKGTPRPAPDDLRRYMMRETPYRTLESARTVYIWNGQHYATWGNNRIEEYAHTHFNPTPSTGVMKAYRELVGSTAVVSSSWFGDSTQGKINFQNGVLDVQTREFLPHDASRGFRYTLPYSYDPSASAPLFEETLSLVTGGDASLQAILLEFMGYVVSGDRYWLHKTLVLLGGGSNGKSTFIDVLGALVGDEAYSTTSIKDLENEYARAMLEGMLLNISEETPTKALLDTSHFKAISSGSPCPARNPYKEPFTLRNRAKLVMACNELSRSTDTSAGFMRRLLIVPFNQKLTRETMPNFDPHISEKLKAELPGIFNLALEAYHRLKQQQQFTASEASDAALSDYELTVNSVKSWVEEELMRLTGQRAAHFSPMQDLYESYRQWAKGRELYPLNYDRFGKEMRRFVVDYNQTYVQRRHPAGRTGRNKRGLLGYGLRADFEHLDEKVPTLDDY